MLVLVPVPVCMCRGACTCVFVGGGTHEYCALSKRKNVSKRENITFQSMYMCICVCMCMCVGMVNSVATVRQSSSMKVGWSSTWCKYVNSIYEIE